MSKFFALTGIVLNFLAVALGAFGAHALKARFTEDPYLGTIFETAVRYHFYQGLALFFVSWAINEWGGSQINIGGWFIFIGTVIFSGSLYILSLTGLRWLGAITPIGGTAILIGWILVFLGVYNNS